VNVVPDFIRGVLDALRGAVYLVTHPRLWKYVLAPAIAAALLLVLVMGSVLGLLSGPIEALSGYLPVSWADNVLRLLAGVILAIASVVIFVSVASMIAGPFNEMLSEAIEERETGVASPPFRPGTFLRDLVVGIAHAARRVAIYLVVMIVLLVVGVAVPVVGSVIAMVLGAIATARFASYDAYDAVWSRHRLRYREKIAYMRGDRWRTLGLGAITSVVLIVPGLNVVGLAIGATGATLRRVSERQGSANPATPTTRASATRS
jgi:CysZ protein